MLESSSAGYDLKARLLQDQIIVAPGIGDALGALLVQEAGFEAVYMSGFAVNAANGRPDIGLSTLTEMVEKAREICDVVSIPVIADADNGYGDVVNVYRTTRDFERAGVSAIQLEDQNFPKQCGSMPGASVVDAREMIDRIKAACDARTTSNFSIIARTDIAASCGLKAAIDRAAQYADAGADLVMALGPYDKQQAVEFIQSARVPVAYLNSESATMPMCNVNELQKLGVKLVIFPLSSVLTRIRAERETLSRIRAQGTSATFSADAMISFNECSALLGLEKIRTWQKALEK